MRPRKRPDQSKAVGAFPKASSRPRTKSEHKLLADISKKVRSDLYHLNKPVEWLAFESETSRATIRRVFDADRNLGIVTLDRVVRALGYPNICEFLSKLK